MTSHPKDMTDDLIECYKDCEKLMPFLHLPIQSGSDKILKLMNRQHDIKYYLSVVKKLQKINKDIKFSSDFIIGYPGETEKDFQETINLVKKIGFFNSYSFIFSSRPGTPSANMKQSNIEESKQRLKKLQNIIESLQLKNNENYVRKTCEVLVENKMKNQDKYFGRTKFMTPVIFKSSDCNIGELVNIQVEKVNKNTLFGFHKSNNVKAA